MKTWHNHLLALAGCALLTLTFTACSQPAKEADSSDAGQVHEELTEETAPLITEEEGESLLAFLSLAERGLYVTDQKRLSAALADGAWPALHWVPGEEVALLRQEDEDDVELFVRFVVWSFLVTRQPEVGDTRLLDSFRRRFELEDVVVDCLETAEPMEVEGREARSRRIVRVRHVELVPTGDVMAPETYADVVRNYHYATGDCREYLGHTPEVRQWIIERGPWPNP